MSSPLFLGLRLHIDTRSIGTQWSLEDTTIPTDPAAALAANLETYLQSIKTDPSHFQKLINLLELLNRPERDDIVSVKIHEAIAELPNELRNSILYGIQKKFGFKLFLDGEDGANVVADDTRNEAIYRVVVKIFAQLPETIFVQQYDIVRDARKTWQERGAALLSLVKLNLDPRPYNNHPIAGPDLNETQLCTEIKQLFLGDDAALADIEGVFRENVRNYLFHKNLQDYFDEKSGEELFAEVRQNPIVEEAIQAVNNGWTIGTPIV